MARVIHRILDLIIIVRSAIKVKQKKLVTQKQLLISLAILKYLPNNIT